MVAGGCDGVVEGVAVGLYVLGVAGLTARSRIALRVGMFALPCIFSLVLALRGWPIERLWLYLTGGGMAVLLGAQLLLWWVMASVLRQLSVQMLEQRAER